MFEYGEKDLTDQYMTDIEDQLLSYWSVDKNSFVFVEDLLYK
jgi:hypothetical protein